MLAADLIITGAVAITAIDVVKPAHDIYRLNSPDDVRAFFDLPYDVYLRMSYWSLYKLRLAVGSNWIYHNPLVFWQILANFRTTDALWFWPTVFTSLWLWFYSSAECGSQVRLVSAFDDAAQDSHSPVGFVGRNIASCHISDEIALGRYYVFD